LTLSVHGHGPAGDATVVVATGAIDLHTAAMLREQVIDLIASGRYHLVLDLDGVHCLDPTGLGVLVGAVKRVGPYQGSLRLVCTRQSILKVILGIGLAKVLPIHASVGEAAAATPACPEVVDTRPA
jgi:anti-sigma B factor antagonist